MEWRLLGIVGTGRPAVAAVAGVVVVGESTRIKIQTVIRQGAAERGSMGGLAIEWKT